MEWLENLLKEAKITDGKLDIAAIMAAVKKEFPDHAVPKQEFNEALEAKKKLESDIKTRDRQLEELKKENGNAEELQEQIKTLQESKPFLFKESKPAGYNPAHGGGEGMANPFAKETFNLTKQGELLRSSPKQAKALAAAAGVTI